MHRLIDLHAHPYMKIHLLPYLAKNLHAMTYNGAHWNPLSLRYQFANLRRSPVKVLLNTHHVVERDFLKSGFKKPLQALLYGLVPLHFHRLRNVDPWESLLEQMDGLEKTVRNTNWTTVFGPRLKLVKSFDQLAGLGANEVAVIHALEGPHVFGYEIPDDLGPEGYWERTRDRLHYLHARGVSMLTISHFWDQPFAPQTDACELIPKIENGRVVRARDDLLISMKRATWKWGENHGLGERLVREMFSIGMVCDLSHTQEHAREAVYDLAADYQRPVVLSHVGVKHFFDHEYNVSDAEFRRIHALGGLVGLIISLRLLLDPIKAYKHDGRGIPLLVEIMRYLADLVGDVSSIGIGTDFDGMTHPFGDCYQPSHLPRIATEMSKHFSDEQIDAIFYGNSLRVLEKGWGGIARPRSATAAPVADDKPKPRRTRAQKAR